MKLDILATAAHPDDVELSCAGTLISHIAQGKKVGIVDFTHGELGTRGTPELRLKEAEAAAKIMGISVRENIGVVDGFFQNDKETQLKLISVIRTYQPEIVLANAVHDRHPDHGKGAKLTYDSCFLSGLRKIETFDKNGNPQLPHRPRLLLNYIQDRWIKPDIVVDISDFLETKIEAMLAFGSQFYNPNDQSKEPQTYISSLNFLEGIKARAKEMGRSCGFEYAEGFTATKFLGVKNLFEVY